MKVFPPLPPSLDVLADNRAIQQALAPMQQRAEGNEDA
jgi:hypothetical protein